MKYLVTGITGFAGPHIARKLLNEEHEVYGLIRGANGRENDLLDILTPKELDSIKFLYGDLKDYQSIRNIFSENEFNGVFHLAAMSHPPTSFKDPIGTMKDNVMGSVYLIDSITRLQPNCIFGMTSTSEVYGDECKEVGVLKEDMPLKPSNPYGTSKAMIDLYVQERCKNRFIKGFIVRPFSYTGPRRGKNFSISWDAFHLAMLKNFQPVHIFPKEKQGRIERMLSRDSIPVGNLKTKRVVMDVRDMCEAYYNLMDGFCAERNGQAYNICGSESDVREMSYFTDKLIEHSGLDVNKVIDKRVFRPIDIQIQIGSTEKIKRETGWQPKIKIDDTLKDLLNYWDKKLK